MILAATAGLRLDQIVGIRANPDQVFHGLALPKIGAKEARVAFPGCLIQEQQAGKDAIQVADDLILEHSGDLEFAQTGPVELLKLQVDSADGLVRRAFAAT